MKVLKIMLNLLNKIFLQLFKNFNKFLSKIYQFVNNCYSYITKKIIIIDINNNNLRHLGSKYLIYYPVPVSFKYKKDFKILIAVYLLVQMILNIFFSNNNILKFLLVKKEELMQYIKKNFSFKNDKYNYVFFAILVFVMLHFTPLLTIVFSIFLIPILHIVPNFKKYFIYKYILIFILIYVPIGFYFYIKGLILVAVELIDKSEDFNTFVIIKNNCVTVDINFLSLNYWKWRFIMIPLMKLPFFNVYISKWFFSTFINQIYALGAFFSHLSGIPFSILVYV